MNIVSRGPNKATLVFHHDEPPFKVMSKISIPKDKSHFAGMMVNDIRSEESKQDGVVFLLTYDPYFDEKALPRIVKLNANNSIMAN